MRCVLCRHGDTKAGEATATLQRGETIIVVKYVPADVCENCGEYYLSDSVAGKIMARAEEAVRNGAEVEVLRYAA